MTQNRIDEAHDATKKAAAELSAALEAANPDADPECVLGAVMSATLPPDCTIDLVRDAAVVLLAQLQCEADEDALNAMQIH